MDDEHITIEVTQDDVHVVLRCKECGQQGEATWAERQDAHILAEERLYVLECVS